MSGSACTQKGPLACSLVSRSSPKACYKTGVGLLEGQSDSCAQLISAGVFVPRHRCWVLVGSSRRSGGQSVRHTPQNWHHARAVPPQVIPACFSAHLRLPVTPCPK